MGFVTAPIILKPTKYLFLSKSQHTLSFAVPPPNRAYLRTLIHSGDLEHLEKVVLDGHGHKLIHETSALEKVTKFIYALPDFMVSSKQAIYRANNNCLHDYTM